jgi:opacity protein-like surface antigen
MGKRTGNDNEISPDTSWAFIKSQLDRGVLRVGVGFFKNYSSLKGVDDYSIEVSAPGLALAYHTKVSRLFYAGVNLGIASFDYTQEFNSDYDQIYIRQTINEKLFTVGFFGRFDLTETFIRPYLLGGVNFNIAHVETNSELSNNVSVKSVNGYTKQAGVKPDLILRGGLDVRLSRRFGVYSDIGTGLNLFQVGVIFIFD